MSTTEANRYRFGRRLLVRVPIASATVISKGDFVCISGGNAVPPTTLLAQGSEKSSRALARNAVVTAFLGIAENSSANGDTDDILVDISIESIYELTQGTAAAVSFGDQATAWHNSTDSISYNTADNSISTAADVADPLAIVVQAHTAAQGAGTRVKLVPQKVLNDASWCKT